MSILGMVYTSKATQSLTSSEIDDLLLSARTSNQVFGITGVLLYGDDKFFQYLEGNEAAVIETFQRICRSRKHSDITVLERRTAPDRLFRNWFMGFRNAPVSLIQRFSQDKWLRELPWASDHVAQSPGMRQLVKFVGATPEEHEYAT